MTEGWRQTARRLALSALLHGAAAVAALAQGPVAIVDVNIVPMDSARVLAHQTLLAEAGRIVRIGPVRDVVVPAGAAVVEGRGAWLMPGLADMHVHLFADSNELGLYLANGVTTIRELSGSPVELAWRREIAAGTRVGPNLIVASPLIDAPGGRRREYLWYAGLTLLLALPIVLGAVIVTRRVSRARKLVLRPIAAVAVLAAAYAVAKEVIPFPDALMPASPGPVPHWWVGSPREAAADVRRAAKDGYDLVKLYERLSPAQFAAATQAARQSHLHSIAHVPNAMRLDDVLRSRLDELAHVYFLVVELQRGDDSSAAAAGTARDSAWARRLRAIAADVARRGVGVTSTLMPLPELREQWTDSTAFLARDDLRYRTAEARRMVHEAMRHGASAEALRDLDQHIQWGRVAVRDLVEAGVPLVAGTDNSPLTAVAGFGMHAEIGELLAAGLTPWQTLSAATVNASRAAGAADAWGQVRIGERADLVLAAGNPLADPATLRRPLGVMVGGRWYGRAALDSMLAAVVRRRAS